MWFSFEIGKCVSPVVKKYEILYLWGNSISKLLSKLNYTYHRYNSKRILLVKLKLVKKAHFCSSYVHVN